MDRQAYQLFPCPTLALDQHVDIDLGDLVDNRLDLVHLWTVGEENLVEILHGTAKERNSDANVRKPESKVSNRLKSIMVRSNVLPDELFRLSSTGER